MAEKIPRKINKAPSQIKMCQKASASKRKKQKTKDDTASKCK